MQPENVLDRIAELLDNFDRNCETNPTFTQIHRMNTLTHIRKAVQAWQDSERIDAEAAMASDLSSLGYGPGGNVAATALALARRGWRK